MSPNNGFAHTLVAFARTLFATSCLLQVVVGVFRPPCTEEKFTAYPSGWPAKLDYGIYFFGKDDAWEKAGPGNKYFDPAKKTLIYIHGYVGAKGGTTKSCYRFTSKCDLELCPDERPEINSWIDQGWNIGFFYWDQFADQPCPRDAEQQIWFEPEETGLTWTRFKLEDGFDTRNKFETSAKSVGELCARSVDDLVSLGFRAPTLRLVGHSLGTQLATHCAALLHDESQGYRLKPSRLTLLDPVLLHEWLPGCNVYHAPDKYVTDAVSRYIESLYRKGVPTDIHISSPMPEELPEMSAFVIEPLVVLIKRQPTWCGSYLSSAVFDRANCRHKAAVPLYFFAGERQGRSGCDPTDPLACTDQELWKHQQKQHQMAVSGWQQVWTQRRGQNTIDTQDDTFEKEKHPLSSEQNVEVLLRVRSADAELMPPPDFRVEQADGASHEGHGDILAFVLVVFAFAFFWMARHRAQRKKKTTTLVREDVPVEDVYDQ